MQDQFHQLQPLFRVTVEKVLAKNTQPMSPTRNMQGSSFISCDDKLIKRCLSRALDIRCGNPVAFSEMKGLK
jgi:hypothetical protein